MVLKSSLLHLLQQSKTQSQWKRERRNQGFGTAQHNTAPSK